MAGENPAQSVAMAGGIRVLIFACNARYDHKYPQISILRLFSYWVWSTCIFFYLPSLLQSSITDVSAHQLALEAGAAGKLFGIHLKLSSSSRLVIFVCRIKYVKCWIPTSSI